MQHWVLVKEEWLPRVLERVYLLVERTQSAQEPMLVAVLLRMLLHRQRAHPHKMIKQQPSSAEEQVQEVESL